jgi:hypothetical protein
MGNTRGAIVVNGALAILRKAAIRDGEARSIRDCCASSRERQSRNSYFCTSEYAEEIALRQTVDHEGPCARTNDRYWTMNWQPC